MRKPHRVEHYVPVDAYFCGFSASPRQKGWTATVSLKSAGGVWTELASWNCNDMTRSERRRQAQVVLTHLLGRLAPAFVVDALVDWPAHDLSRLEVPALRGWVTDYGLQLTLL